MKHLFVGESDYAASGNMFSLALRSAGEETQCLVGRHHIFKYPEQGELITHHEQVRAGMEWADFVWVIQSDLPEKLGGTYGSIHANPARNLWLDYMKRKKVVLLHGGGHYRDNREFYKKLWEPLNPISICYEADLMGSFKREHLVIPPVNLKWFEPQPRRWDFLRVGHFPSRPTDKGSEWIVPMMRGMKDVDFITSVRNPFDAERGAERLPWQQHLSRMAECDVIVDQIKPHLNGVRFGEWVSIATEAAALGCISIANSHDTKPYAKTYGIEPGIRVCNDATALAIEIERIKRLPEDLLQEEKSKSRKWIESYHALEPTGKKLKQICEIS